jgi:thiamine transporter
MKFDTKRITFTAMMIALALIFEIFSTFVLPLPQGGNVSVVAIPLIILGYYYGVPTAMIGGVIVGVSQGLFVPPFVVNPIQYLLDYVFPFAFMGMATIFIKSNPKQENILLSLGILLSLSLRYISHVISGTLFFAEFAGDQIPIIYSLIYNITFIGPTLIITLILAPLVLVAAKKVIKL